MPPRTVTEMDLDDDAFLAVAAREASSLYVGFACCLCTAFLSCIPYCCFYKGSTEEMMKKMDADKAKKAKEAHALAIAPLVVVTEPIPIQSAAGAAVTSTEPIA